MITGLSPPPGGNGGVRAGPPRWAWGLLFLLAPAGMMIRVLASGHAIGGYDLDLMYYPFWDYLGHALRHGRLPLWDPDMDAGIPFVASLQSQSLYPPAALLMAALPLHAAAFAFLFGHLYWAGLGTTALGRRLGLDRPTALGAGTLAASAPIFFSALVRPNNLSAVSWLPWMLLAADRVCRGRPRGVPALAACVGLGLLCASPEVTLLGVLATAGLAFWHARRGRWAAVPLCAAAGLLGIAAAAAALIPFAELLRHSSRGGDIEGMEGVWSFGRGDFAGLLLPFLNVGAPQRTAQEIFSGSFQGVLSVVYLGTPAAVLAAVAAIRGRKRERWLLAAIAPLLLLGAYGGQLSLALEKLHLAALAWRYPVKFIFPLPFVVALLASLGAQRAATAAPGRAPMALSVAGGAAVLTGLLGLHRLEIGVASSVAWVGLGLLALAAILRWVPAGLWRQWAVVALCAVDATLCSFRIPVENQSSLCGAFFAAVKARVGSGRLEALSGVEIENGFGFYEAVPGLANACLLGNKAAQFGVPAIRFYGTPAPIGAMDLSDNFGSLGDGILGAALVLRSVPTPAPGLVPIEAPELAPLWAATIPGAAPRVELRAGTRVSDRDHLVADLRHETLEQARREVVLEHPPPPASAAGAPYEGADLARLVSDGGERVAVETASASERWLVLADQYYPGWVATVDGVLAPIRRSYGAVRAVRLGAGRHRVVFEYRPASFRAGALVSAVTLLGLLAAALARRPKRS
ncbi:MAG: YfhO family protein [Myxococcales bacterium]